MSVRLAMRPDGAPHPSARQRRPIDDPRALGQETGARAGPRVDRHLLADRETDPRGARVEERERIDLGRDTERVETRLLHRRVVALIALPLVDLVLTATIRSTAAGLVSLAHGDSSSLR